MAMNAGIWIDHHKAIVVLLSDVGEEVRQFLSDRGDATRSLVSAQRKHTCTPDEFEVETKRERKAMLQLIDFYDRIITCIRDAQSILILGPGEAKSEFRRRVAAKKLKGRIARTETVDTMSDREIATHVRQLFRTGLQHAGSIDAGIR